MWAIQIRIYLHFIQKKYFWNKKIYIYFVENKPKTYFHAFWPKTSPTQANMAISEFLICVSRLANPTTHGWRPNLGLRTGHTFFGQRNIRPTFEKLDVVALLITNALPTSFTTLSEKKKKKIKEKMLLTWDTWQMTCDPWHVLHYVGQVGGGEPSLKMSAP